MIVLWILSGIVGLILLFLLVLVLSALFVKKKEYDKDSKYFRGLLNFLTPIALWLTRIKVIVSGKEKLKGVDGRILMVSNHRSNYDPICEWYVLKKYNLAFVSKPENFKIPIAGAIARKCCFRAIDRQNPRNAIETIKSAAELIKSGEVSIGVNPEGTRSKTCELLPFHDGVFKIAKLANVPIVVIAIYGTEKAKRNYPFKRTYVHLDIIDVIGKEEVDSLSTHELSDRVREELLIALEGK